MSDDFWNKRASILQYHGELHRKKRQGQSIKRSTARTNDELYREAVEHTGHLSFSSLLRQYNIETKFANLTSNDILAATGIGVLGALTAVWTSALGRKVEPKLWANYDRNHPSDYFTGKDHRYPFGHDVLNINQKLPPGFIWRGRDVGGKSLIQMVNHAYPVSSGNPAAQALSSTTHLLVHWLRDFITPAGLPLPGSSRFTKWTKNVLNTCGYSSNNALMDTLGREFGTLHASDFTSIGLIKILNKGYITQQASIYSPDRFQIFDRQIKVISYGSCIIAQMAILMPIIIKDPQVRRKVDGAKLNLIMLGLFGKSVVDLMMLSEKEHQQILRNYEKSINTLLNSERSFEEWIKSLDS
ncbi:hypothetical protein FRC98_09620 [Lujinxingia vulgaris]|uniref:Uncharacterized protein n=1 Tax=Lujinxingia vulgaris TaxID=2600176 RepID=A0A5C6X5B2_9DELT|nr:hypothetical protein [Lujinxingia vulgaris]TXD36990.1 hypothetical protein FRC98_09620 [Lujinxingia vulgaris]